MHRVQLARCVAHIAVNRQILVVVFRRDAQKGCAPQTLHWQYVYYWRLICCEAVRGELLFAKGMLPCLPLLLPVRGPGIGNAWNRAPNPLAEPGGLHHVGPSLATFAHGECASYHRVPTPCTVPGRLAFSARTCAQKGFSLPCSAAGNSYDQNTLRRDDGGFASSALASETGCEKVREAFQHRPASLELAFDRVLNLC